MENPMSKGQRPVFRFLTKDEGDEQLHEIGAVWATAKADVFSVSLDLEGTGEKINFMMVPNKPKAAASGPETELPTERPRTQARRKSAAQSRPAD